MEGTDDVIVMSKARQENTLSGREKLNIFDTNARSSNNKMEELEAKVDNEEYDIVAVSETWVQEESNWRTGLEGYKVNRCDVKERIGGGVAIWVKDSIASRERGDIKEGINVEDSVWVEIRDCKNSKILVGCFSKAPGVKEEEEGGVHEEFKRACGEGTVLTCQG